MRSKALRLAEGSTDFTLAHEVNLQELTHVVGRTNTENVVLQSVVNQGGTYVARIHIDKAHPAMFDHPLDHIPGMLLIEAFRQTALYCANKQYGLHHNEIFMKACDIDFTKFTEFNPTAYCIANSITYDSKFHEIALSLSIHQNDAITALCHIRMLQKKAPL